MAEYNKKLIDIELLKEKYRVSTEAYELSRIDAEEVLDFYHNYQYDDFTINSIRNVGQPVETYNIIKWFAHILTAHYATQVQTIKVMPQTERDTDLAFVLQDLLDVIFRQNKMETEGDKIKLHGLLTGLLCSYQTAIDTGKKDEYGRPIYQVKIVHIPSDEIMLDPMSRLEDYSDAEYIHRHKWISMRQLKKRFKLSKETIDNLEAYRNTTDNPFADFDRKHPNQNRHNIYRTDEFFMVVHTIIEDDDGDVWSCYWCCDEILLKEKIEYKEFKFPYRVEKLYQGNRTSYYGVFREIMEIQKSINQCLIKIQRLANTAKVLVNNTAVTDRAQFVDDISSISAVAFVDDINGIRVEQRKAEISDQYILIDRLLERAKNIIGITDSMLGISAASDSGRKFQLEHNVSIYSLNYLTKRIEQYYRMLARDVLALVKETYTAHQVISVVDQDLGARWLEINKPIQFSPELADSIPTNAFIDDKNNIVEMKQDDDGVPEYDANGEILVEPIPTKDSQIYFADTQIEIDTQDTHNDQERAQIVYETMLSGAAGQAMLQINPADFFGANADIIKLLGVRKGQKLIDRFERTAQLVAQQGNQPPEEESPLPKKQSQQLRVPRG